MYIFWIISAIVTAFLVLKYFSDTFLKGIFLLCIIAAQLYFFILYDPFALADQYPTFREIRTALPIFF